VKVLVLKDGRHVARWVDPLSRRQQQQSFDKLGITSGATRRAWAVSKSNALATLRQAVSLNAVRVERVPVAAAVKTYLEGIGHAQTRASKQYPLDALVERLKAAGITMLSDLAGPTLVVAWRDWVAAPRRDHQPGTRTLWLQAVGTFLRHARRRGMVPLLTLEAIKDSCGRLSKPSEEVEFLSMSDLRRVLEAAIAHDAADKRGRRIAPFVMLLALTGCRRREATMLTWGEVHDDGLHLLASRVKTRRARVVTHAEAPTVRTLIAHLRPADANDADLVFPEMEVAWENATIRMVKNHGAPAFTAHVLRRTACCILANAAGIHGAASLWHAAKRAGHSAVQCERDYAGRMTGLPADAKCIEDAAGIRDLCEKIVASAAALATSLIVEAQQ
jgi:integrase